MDADKTLPGSMQVRCTFVRLLRDAGFHVAEARTLIEVRALVDAPTASRPAGLLAWLGA